MTIEINRTVSVGVEEYNRLFALVEWYNAMPDEMVGDRFHENVNDIIDGLLPQFDEVTNDDMYQNTVFVDDNRMFVELGDNNNGDEGHIFIEVTR